MTDSRSLLLSLTCIKQASYLISWSLRQIAEECQKPDGVDLWLMLDRCKECQVMLDILKAGDPSERRKVAFKSLSTSVAHFQETFSAKADQLKNLDSQSSGEDPEATNEDKHVKNRRLAIKDTIIHKGNLRFDDVAGLAEAKQSLKEAIIMPLLYPHLFVGGCKPWRRILLYGPPGTGKSRLAQAVSSEIKSTFYCVSSSDLVSSFVGESEKLIKELFCHATAQQGRSVIFIDEIDSICRQRSSREEEHTRRIKTELLKQMEGADNSAKNDKIFLLCATNCPWELDSAFLRRFQKRIYIPLPDRSARISLAQIHCKNNPVSLTAADWDTLGGHTAGYSGSDLANVVLEALYQPIRDMQAATHWKHSQEKLVMCLEADPGAFQASLQDLPPDQVKPSDVTIDHFLKSLAHHHRTVSDEELARFEQFTKQLGQNG